MVAWISGRNDALSTSCERSLDDLNVKPPATAGDVDLSVCETPREEAP
jgi:hypothetical protein